MSPVTRLSAAHAKALGWRDFGALRELHQGPSNTANRDRQSPAPDRAIDGAAADPAVRCRLVRVTRLFEASCEAFRAAAGCDAGPRNADRAPRIDELMVATAVGDRSRWGEVAPREPVAEPRCAPQGLRTGKPRSRSPGAVS